MRIKTTVFYVILKWFLYNTVDILKFEFDGGL